MDRPDVAGIFGVDAENAGYKITIQMSDIPAGEHTLHLLLKTTDGNIYEMTKWGELTVIGGETETETETEA